MAEGIISNPTSTATSTAELDIKPSDGVKKEKPAATGNKSKKRGGASKAKGTTKRAKNMSGTGRAIIDLTGDSDDE